MAHWKQVHIPDSQHRLHQEARSELSTVAFQRRAMLVGQRLVKDSEALLLARPGIYIHPHTMKGLSKARPAGQPWTNRIFVNGLCKVRRMVFWIFSIPSRQSQNGTHSLFKYYVFPSWTSAIHKLRWLKTDALKVAACDNWDNQLTQSEVLAWQTKACYKGSVWSHQ